MSAYEVAGIVLGVLPIIIGGLQQYPKSITATFLGAEHEPRYLSGRLPLRNAEPPCPKQCGAHFRRMGNCQRLQGLQSIELLRLLDTCNADEP